MNKEKSEDGFLPKFFKVYLPDESGDDLTLPISFNRFIPNSLSRKVIVRSIYGNVWKLELRKCYGDDDNVEKLVMANGWKRIVKDEDLVGGEFLVFEFDGSRLFNFCIYGYATCKRLRSLAESNEKEDKTDDQSHKCSEDIIVIGRDDSDDVSEFQEYGDQGDGIIVISSDDDDQDDDDDDDERMIGGKTM